MRLYRPTAALGILYAALIAITAPAFISSASAAVTERSVYYSYDLAGRQLSATFDSASGTDGVSNVYDGFGELKSATLTMGTFSKTLASSYDAGGRRTQLVHPENTSTYTFSYCYDALSRLTTVAQGTNCTTAPLDGFTYTNAGLPNVRSEGAGTGVASATWGWDDVGRLTSQSDVFTGTTTKNVNWGFTLDPASEIASEARTIPNSTSDPYAYGGLLSVNRTYGVNGLNQYTSAGSASFTYDANGNLTSDGSNTYVYDVENRLVQATDSKRNVTNLTYDPLGRLYQVDQGSNSSTTRFLYDGDALALEYNSNNVVQQRYVHGSNAAADDPLVWYSGANLGTVRYLHADHLGSIVAIASSTGASYAVNSYDEYGINGSANNTSERFGYTGQAWIPELGMYYYKARIYSPTLGRFLQTDPIGYKDQINLYAYVGDDPVDRTDPSGSLGNCPGTQLSCPTPEQLNKTREIFTGSRLGPTIGSPVQSQQIAPDHPQDHSAAGRSLTGAVAQSQQSLADAARATGATERQVVPLRALGHTVNILAAGLKAQQLHQEGHSIQASVAGGVGSLGPGAAIGAGIGTFVEPGGATILLGIAGAGIDEVLGLGDKAGDATADFFDLPNGRDQGALPTCRPMAAAGC